MALTLSLKLAVVSYLVHLIVAPGGAPAWVGHILVDVAGWMPFWRDTQAGAIPFVDITREYPVGAGMVYWGISAFLNLQDWLQVVYRQSLAMIPPDLINVVLLYKILERVPAGRGTEGGLKSPPGGGTEGGRNKNRAFWLTLLWTLTPTGLVLGPVRFEGYVICFALLGYWFHQGKRPLLAALVWSIGCWFKWYPAFFLAAQEVEVLWQLFSGRGSRPDEPAPPRIGGAALPPLAPPRWQWLQSTAIFAVVALAVNLPFILAGLARHGSYMPWWAPYRFHATRPLYWDTVLGVLTLYNQPNVIWWERLAPLWTIPLMLLCMIVRPGLRVESRGALICMAAVLLNRVYSTQFNLWFDPFLLILIARTQHRDWFWGMLAAYVFTDLLNVFIYPFSFAWCLQEIGQFAPYRAAEAGRLGTVLFSQAILLRMVVIAVWMAVVFYEPCRLGEEASEAEPASADRPRGRSRRRR